MKVPYSRDMGDNSSALLYAVLPFYNEARTLHRCLDSLKFLDRVYAIDGRFRRFRGGSDISTDGSREICSEYANVTLLDLPGSNVQAKLNLGFRQSTGPRDACFMIDADCYMEGDTQRFRREAAKRAPWKGAAGLHIHYKMWSRHPEYTGLDNVIYRLVNPWQKMVHGRLHGVYLDDGGTVQWPLWTMPGITMIHDDSGRPSTYDVGYLETVDREEAGVMRQFDREQPYPLMRRVRMRANRVLNPEWYPAPFIPPPARTDRNKHA